MASPDEIRAAATEEAAKEIIERAGALFKATATRDSLGNRYPTYSRDACLAAATALVLSKGALWQAAQPVTRLGRQRGKAAGEYANADTQIGTTWYGFDYDHDKVRQALADAFADGWDAALAARRES